MSQSFASEPQSIGGVLDQGFRLFRTGFGRVFGLALMCALLLLLVQVSQFVGALSAVPGEPLGFPVPSWFGSASFAIIVIGNLAYFATANSIWHRYWTHAHNTGSFGDSLRAGLRRFLPAVGSTILSMLVIVVTAIPAGVAVAMLYASRPLQAIGAALLLALIPAYFFTRLAFTMIEVVVRPSGPIEALRRSWALTAGNFWRVSAIAIVILVIAMVFYFIAAMLAGLGAVFFVSSPVGMALLTLGLVLVVVLLLVLPYCMAAWIAVWHDLRLRAEGGDLAARIDALPAA